MRYDRVMRFFWLSLGVVAACGGDDGGEPVPSPVDAAVPTIHLRGTLSGPDVSDPGLVAAFARGADLVPVARSIPASNVYDLEVPLTDGAFDGYLRVERALSLPTYYYPDAPFTADTSTLLALYGETGLARFEERAGVTRTHRGRVLVLVTDDSTGLSDAVVGTTPAGAVRYLDGDGRPDAAMTATGIAGAAFVFDAPVGAMTITATKPGASFGTHSIEVRADVITQTVVR